MDLSHSEKRRLKKEKEELITFKGGASSSKIPRYDLLVSNALRRLSARCEKGLENYKDKAWNARQNHQVLLDKEWLIARAMHAVDHAYKFIDKLEGRIKDDGDDDASAIMWAGMCLCSGDEAIKNTDRKHSSVTTSRIKLPEEKLNGSVFLSDNKSIFNTLRETLNAEYDKSTKRTAKMRRRDKRDKQQSA